MPHYFVCVFICMTNPIQFLLNKLNGLHYSQDYLCLAKDDLVHPLHAYLVEEGRAAKDITKHHAFVGYHPLVFAFHSSVLSPRPQIELAFTEHPITNNEEIKKKDALAWLSMEMIRSMKAGVEEIYFYCGIHGSHRFTSRAGQWASELNDQIFNRKPGNVFLEGNLFTQVRIAYSIPRKICLITLGEKERFNEFPTDLHGTMGPEHYLVSLRHEGKAARQLMQFKTMVLSDMPASAYKKVYGLGKNHMQEPREKEAFQFSSERSMTKGLPLPESYLGYKELELVDHFNWGIHGIFLFKVKYASESNESNSLVHIHNEFASWLYKNGKPGNFLLR
ncbi:MAG: flavin reductase [Flavisolibacter sp.]